VLRFALAKKHPIRLRAERNIISFRFGDELRRRIVACSMVWAAYCLMIVIRYN
jgi:hypothetical protein